MRAILAKESYTSKISAHEFIFTYIYLNSDTFRFLVLFAASA